MLMGKTKLDKLLRDYIKLTDHIDGYLLCNYQRSGLNILFEDTTHKQIVGFKNYGHLKQIYESLRKKIEQAENNLRLPSGYYMAKYDNKSTPVHLNADRRQIKSLHKYNGNYHHKITDFYDYERIDTT
jgi:LPS sulfotransferase NodH